MTQERLAEEVADDLPKRLRVLRAENMLKGRARALGVEEVTCPACGGTGWLNRRSLWRCPLCYCTRDVPRGVAQWYRAEMRRRRRGEGPSAEPADARAAERPSPRPGRRAEQVHSVRGHTPAAQGL